MSQYIAMIVVHAHDRYTARIAYNFCGDFFCGFRVKFSQMAVLQCEKRGY